MYNKGTLLVAARPTAAIFTISNWIFSLKNPVIKIEFPALNKTKNGLIHKKAM